MSKIAVIPARGGSKRIPGKNIRPFHGKPIIGYAIEAALESRLFDRVVVSTDCESIARVARAQGGQVPFLRSEETSDDRATMAQAVIETLERLSRAGQDYDEVCCLFATAPFVTADLIRHGLELLQRDAGDSVVSVKRVPYPLMRSLQQNDEGYLRMVWEEHLRTRSQDLANTCHDAAQLYWARTSALQAQGTFYTAKASALFIEELDAHDIDTPEDWAIAEKIWSFNRFMKVAA